jgi:hypothetical protein
MTKLTENVQSESDIDLTEELRTDTCELTVDELTQVAGGMRRAVIE